MQAVMAAKAPDMRGGPGAERRTRPRKRTESGRLWPGAVFLFLFLLLPSCTPFAVPDRSAGAPSLPPSYSLNDSVAAPPQRWWETFDSPLLDRLIAEALSGNQTLRSYWARVARAQALARVAGSELYPSLTGEGDAAYSETRTGEDGSGRTDDADRYSLGLFASYEVDLWGRVRAETKSAGLTEAASRDDLHTAAVTVAAEVADRWIRIIANQRRLLLLQQQLATNQTYLELVELRFRKSLASALDVMQQKQLVERVRARIPLAEMEGQLLRNGLAVLLGRLPHELPAIDLQPLPVISDLPAAGVPVQLLDNRPDIRAALHRLEAADQDLVAARADRLPALRLTGRTAYDSGTLEDIFDNWLVNLAAGLTAPIVDGGRRRAQVAASAAGVDDRLALYRQTVLTAVQEVEESLTGEIKIREHIKLTGKQLDAANKALAEARNRYLKGLNDYLPVLTQLLSVQDLEIDLIARREDLFLARINLYRSLGGTWIGELPSPEGYAKIDEDK